MITEEAQTQAQELLLTISARLEELSGIIEEQLHEGNLDSPVTQIAIGSALMQLTSGFSVLYSGVLAKFATPETIGLVPDSVLPDFSLEVPAGTPDN